MESQARTSRMVAAVASASDKQPNVGRKPGRIGTWRLLDLVHATVGSRSTLSGGAVLPEFGPADEKFSTVDPESELPGSNLTEHEQRGAIQREAARRFASSRVRS